MKYEHWNFKDEEQQRESSQWKELFEGFPKLVAIGDWFVLRSPIHLNASLITMTTMAADAADGISIAVPSQRTSLSTRAILLLA